MGKLEVITANKFCDNKDSDGVMWFGLEFGGFSRYDGQMFAKSGRAAADP
jgi:hypothetical protein